MLIPRLTAYCSALLLLSCGASQAQVTVSATAPPSAVAFGIPHDGDVWRDEVHYAYGGLRFDVEDERTESATQMLSSGIVDAAEYADGWYFITESGQAYRSATFLGALESLGQVNVVGISRWGNGTRANLTTMVNELMLVEGGTLVPEASLSNFLVAHAYVTESEFWITTTDGAHFRRDGGVWTRNDAVPEEALALPIDHHLAVVPDAVHRVFPATVLRGAPMQRLFSRGTVYAAYLGNGRFITPGGVHAGGRFTPASNPPDEVLSAKPVGDALFASVRRGALVDIERLGEDGRWTAVTLPRTLTPQRLFELREYDQIIPFTEDGRVGFHRVDALGEAHFIDTEESLDHIVVRGDHAYVATAEGVDVIHVDTGAVQRLALPGERPRRGRIYPAGASAIFSRAAHEGSRYYVVEGTSVRRMQLPDGALNFHISPTGELALAFGANGVFHASQDTGLTWQEVPVGAGVEALSGGLAQCVHDACILGDLIIGLSDGPEAGPAFETLATEPLGELDTAQWDCDAEHRGDASPSLGSAELDGDVLVLSWQFEGANRRRRVPLPAPLREVMESVDAVPAFEVRAGTRDVVWIDVHFSAPDKIVSLLSGRSEVHVLTDEDSVRWARARRDGGLDVLGRTLGQIDASGILEFGSSRNAALVDGNVGPLEGDVDLYSESEVENPYDLSEQLMSRRVLDAFFFAYRRLGVRSPRRLVFRYHPARLLQAACQASAPDTPLALVQHAIPASMFGVPTTRMMILGIRFGGDTPCLEFASTIYGTVRPSGDGNWEGPTLRCEPLRYE